MKVFENQNIVIELDKDLQCVIQNWRGFASSEKYREAIHQTIDLFKTHKVDKILSNTKSFGIVKKEDTDWTNSYAMPILIERGLKYAAFIAPENVLPQMSIENFRRGSNGLIEIQYFEEVKNAKQWMEELSKRDRNNS